ncbi:DUF1003 domain-containing protein [Paraliomyxa miuraensis]|uniref:DUF1003 domain-containing protein n=1 Tax=Paraliomyxa miuraensis TaxID=376150 RepID=UPI0022595C34|nr:DUF1003 domain-containing protein [Paraliomyxa miuraensis]MCX4245479.1 DUF1003 domain-containing protein [Paraliomyxa miuraensis]
MSQATSRPPPTSEPPAGPQTSSMARVVERNIRALLEHRREVERRAGWPERLAHAITRFAGSMTFVLLHVVFYGSWITINLGAIPGVPPFDPSFVGLAMEASVEALFLSAFILITQNRMMAAAAERADLDLQISLLAEHEITRVITLVQEMAKKMNVAAAHDPELRELAEDVHPERVLQTMAAHEQVAEAD